jgi:hypothetical protein
VKDNEGFLHRHTGQESALNLHESMVIVGKSDWEKAREMFVAIESVQVGEGAPISTSATASPAPEKKKRASRGSDAEAGN